MKLSRKILSALLVLALLYLAAAGRRKTVVASVLLFLFCCVFGHGDSFAFWETDLAYEGESIYNYLQVKDDDRRTVLSTNVLFGVQSIRQKDGGLTGMYYDVALAAPFLAGAKEKEGLRVAILGNGTGTFASQCVRYLEKPRVEAVEIDGGGAFGQT